MPKFGPSGNSESFYSDGHKSSVEMPAWLRDKGLDAYEYSCSKGVKIKRQTAEMLGDEAEKNDIYLSIHAPYYINMASSESKKRKNSIRYVMETLKVAKYMRAERVVVHTGSCSGMDRTDALNRAESVLLEVLREAENESLLNITICPELLGKKNQLGSLEEILHICGIDDRLLPAVDFAHLHARTGGSLDSPEVFDRVVDEIENALGAERTRHMHVHFSRIEYTQGGERRHLKFADTEYGPDFKPFAHVICKRSLEPVIICESRGTMAEDALEMKAVYQNIRRNLTE